MLFVAVTIKDVRNIFLVTILKEIKVICESICASRAPTQKETTKITIFNIIFRSVF